MKATANFNGFGFIDGDKYDTQDLRYGSTNVFFRQIRNLVFDYSNVPIGSSLAGIHWPTSQATSLQNLVFNMNSASGSQHVGIFSESGSAGFMNDLTFNGGHFGLQIGNQQFSMRNLIFNNVNTAISHFWSWGWLYQGIKINNCAVGIDISAGGRTAQSVGSITMIDSTISNTPIGFITAFDTTSMPTAAGSLILENVVLSNVPTAIQKAGGGTILAGGSTTIAAWGQGNKYTPDAAGPTRFQGSFTPNSRPAALLSGNVFYSRSKPQYNTLPVSSFQSVRSAGATGNGVADDTSALQNIINSATAAGKVVYIDSGTYRITSTLTIPPGAKIVGETYPIIMSSGSFFNDMNNPKPVVKVGSAGQGGQVELSDFIVSTQGAQAGAIGIEYNLATSGTPSGMWDVHVRVGGFAGSNLQIAQCAKTPGNPAVNSACVAAYMSMHVTAQSSGLYMENMWFWTADHDIDSSANTQVTVYNGRGLYIESTTGTFWLVGTSSEHHVFYQYQLANTKNLFMGFIQTETPYYQPTPSAPTPFTVNTALNDPNFASSCAGKSGNCANAWGLRILNSHDVLVYGAGLYSFFNDYSTTCSNMGGPENCQNNIFSLEGSISNVNVYNLNTVGTVNMITQNGNTLATYSDNVNVFPDTIALFKASGSAGTVTPPSSPTSSSAPSSVPTGAKWTALGCYTDSVSARTLSVGTSVPGGAGAMSIEACQSACVAGGYVYSGVEYAQECCKFLPYSPHFF